MELRFDGVAFDLDHTLLVDNRLERVALLDLIVRLDAAGTPLRLSLDRAGAIADEELSRYRNEGEELDTMLNRFVERCGGRGGASWAPWYRQRCLDLVGALVLPMPAARRSLTALAEAGLKIAALSNGPSPLQERKAAQIGFYDLVLSSEQIGVRKPEPAAFERLAASMGVAPSRLAYVGDDPLLDIVGALKVGISAIWFDGAEKRYPADLPVPTAVIHSLDELLPLCSVAAI
ncbi:MAG: HAD family hydrolase [Candidatus Eremiobacteraeota bacterium]|nr:HAD family hydrolase [Candidatus Eremiobacteraeota bacterium]NNM93467.1 HAD family hydrolase [Candidatus Eremiobacteraeota bacterium]